MRTAEPELYKDKIEISLDGRQVFYLFFGGAVIACLVFVLGVMVGRRVEARSHVDRAAATSASRDPLAALDQMDASDQDTSFRTSLGAGSGSGAVDPAVAAIEKTKAAAEAAKVAPPPPAPAPAVAAKPADKPADKVADKKPKKPDAEAAADAPAAEPPAAAPAADPDAGKFTLQLSSFKDKTEAESFMADMKSAGFKTYVVEADVDGKGTFFRVRVGHYDSYQSALDAKASFESKVNKIAYVTRL
jgi:cell division septation protein DedD